MKKVLLFNIVFLFLTLCAFAYETIIIDFPPKELWEKGYYKKKGNEAILQYILHGESSENWTRSIVVHSYNEVTYPANVFLNNNMRKLQKANPTAKFKILKLTQYDAIMGRCTNDYNNVQGQCEFFRVIQGHGGTVTLHYMNKDKEEFMYDYCKWYDIIRKAKLYNTYYRDERMLDKSLYFEL